MEDALKLSDYWHEIEPEPAAAGRTEGFSFPATAFPAPPSISVDKTKSPEAESLIRQCCSAEVQQHIWKTKIAQETVGGRQTSTKIHQRYH